ncbi:hypothetical protein FF38_10977 [Lucilia cuprina]|uniref:Uncharacterized protein n=1 Tax=Lucilia cuprina TaxID=7375 RepID=A0A0L0BXD9_LUCCU|nr:hypothetical protein FF38_10977 [Lucilia cuprina]
MIVIKARTIEDHVPNFIDLSSKLRPVLRLQGYGQTDIATQKMIRTNISLRYKYQHKSNIPSSLSKVLKVAINMVHFVSSSLISHQIKERYKVYKKILRFHYGYTNMLKMAILTTLIHINQQYLKSSSADESPSNSRTSCHMGVLTLDIIIKRLIYNMHN